MSLFSLEFFVFLVIVSAFYFCLPKRFQWVCLLIASYVFYAWANIRIVAFLLFSTVSTFLVGLWLQKKNDEYAKMLADAAAEGVRIDKKALKKVWTKKKRWILAAGLVSNFLILGVVKYANFAIENLNSVLAAAGTGFSLNFINVVLPLGISFYTFQSAGYLIDVYRGKVEADRNIFRYALFVSYFPQIIQGPIGRHRDLAHQLFAPHAFDYTRVKFGLQRILWGFFKKLVIAERASVIVNQVFDNFRGEGYEGIILFLAAALYSVQIYGDFSGGIDIICGVSEIFGIELAENFKRPFFARSVSEFWQRWHITLGSWMRDYVFYPLALSKPFNRLGKSLRKFGSSYAAKVIPTCLASFIVFLLVGVWHGASWKYVAYGLYSAVFVSTATLLEPFYAKVREFFHVQPERFSFRCFQILRTNVLVIIGRYLSRANSFADALLMYKGTVTVWNPWVLVDGTLYELGLNRGNFSFLLLMIGLLLCVDYLQEKGYHLRESIAKQGIVFRWTIYIAALLAVLVFGMYGPAYNAADFVYQGF